MSVTVPHRRLARRGPRAALVACALAIAAIGGAPALAGAAPTVPVTGQTTAVALDPGLAAGLTSLGAKVKNTGNSNVDSAGRIVFPVTGGRITADLKGVINHTGGIELRNRFGVAFGIQSFGIDTRSAPALTAIPTVAGASLGIRLPVATITGIAAHAEGNVTVVTSTIVLNAIGALYLNTFLGTPAVKAGTVFGQAETRVTTG